MVLGTMWQKLMAVWHRRRLDHELDEELRFHLDAQIEENVAAGMSPVEARRAALRDFGGVEATKEAHRDARGITWLDSVWQDVRFAVRGLRRSPGFAVTAIVTLALGIGANTAVFSIVYAFAFRMLPFPEPERLVMIESWHPNRGNTSVGPDDFRDWHERNTVFEEMAYTFGSYLTLSGEDVGEPERIGGAQISRGFFEVLGVRPELGRWFLPEEYKVGTPVIVLSHRLWRRRFGGRPDIINKTMVLDDRHYTVVGVMPASFRFNENRLTEYWIPLAHYASGYFVHQYQAYARLQPGITVEAAQAEMNAIARQIEAEHPDSNTGWGVRVTGLKDALSRTFGPALLLFWATVVIVFFIACANVANLLLARGASRGGELAVRRTLGAGRWRLVRLLVVESLLISIAAGASGLLLVRWLIDLAVTAAPSYLDLRSILHVDRRVLLFALALSVLTSLLTGLVPAVQAMRMDVNRVLALGGGVVRSGTGAHRSTNAFVASQVALAVLLVVLAGLLTKDTLRLLTVDLGYRTESVLALRVNHPRSRYSDPQQRETFLDRLSEGVNALPGVLSTGAGLAIPLGNTYTGNSIEIEGQPKPEDWTRMSVQFNSASLDYFRTLGIPLLLGRTFVKTDREGSEPVVIVNDEFCRRYLSGVEPIGRRIRSGSREWMTIVGVVGSVRQQGPEHTAEPQMYRPVTQIGSSYAYFVVHTDGPPLALARPIRAVVQSIDPTLSVEIRTMEELLAEAVSERRHIMTVVTFFSFVALTLAAVGLGGMLWRGVSMRAREIGIRMALGARPADVEREVLSRSAVLVLTGLVIGVGAAFMLARLIHTLLFGVSPHDPSVFLLAALLVVVIAIGASWLPARRAAGINPADTLRHE